MRKLLLSLSAIVLFVSTSFAQGAEKAAGSQLSSILMLLVFFAIFWF
ncbi:preprotein translocase subunit YajC, partial [Francisella tularensis subsp. holarctica]|nr:preprotein translocase subunit YajC [Francisella tularensis subsp. holarctica]